MARCTTYLVTGIVAALVAACGEDGQRTSDGVTGQPNPDAADGWGKAVNGLQTRIVLEKKAFARGGPITAKVVARNVTDKPIRYDGRRRGDKDLVYLDGTDEKLIPERDVADQVALLVYGEPAELTLHTGVVPWDENRTPKPKSVYDFPALDPGKEIEVDIQRLTRDKQVLVPGRYRATWGGTSVRRAEEFDLGALPGMVFGDKWQKWFGELDEKARKVAVGLPAAALEFDVAGPRDAASGLGVLARIQKAMPVGWKIEGILIPAEKIRGADMSDGRCVVPGCTVAVRLVHRPVPGCLVGDMTYLRLDVTPDRVPAETEREQELVYLGRGPLGHAYLTGDVGGRWSHAAYDIAMAVGVTEQGPQKPDGPDWGRTVSRILWKCYKKVNDEDARTSPWEHLLGHAHLRREATELARIEYTQNLVPPTKTQPAAREDPQHPYYRFHLSVRPTTAEHQLDMDTADRAIKWDGASVTRGYTVKRLGVDIVVTVLSDDAAFVAALNDVVDREITRVLALPGPASP